MAQPKQTLLLYGRHPVALALQNKRRAILEIQMVSGALDIPASAGVPVRIVPKAQLDALAGRDVPHQGVVAKCLPLPPLPLDDWLAQARADKMQVVLLDQVTDPHNIGAILRSAVAFGAAAVILPDANTPDETGALAKSASGALELIPLIRVPNLARAMERLKKDGFWCIGLDGAAPAELPRQKLPAKCAFVMGSEGEGMRRLTLESCDMLARLPMGDAIESLNVSNAAAIALYEWRRQHI
ncbi:MAG: 23S rRNA (guanosine(2251)-2'-O)-methyltransferase RlmB [Alphaproteobacteria bacterium]|nr:23S rRNA (guanosine(2251)-2'-O)-methyltransferase RlmB [Alphaproteobacteria bacterium]